MMTPDLLCKQADHLLRLVAGQETMSKNPSELAAVLRTAASACDQISMHNDMVLSMTELYNK